MCPKIYISLIAVRELCALRNIFALIVKSEVCALRNTLALIVI